jgi:integrase
MGAPSDKTQKVYGSSGRVGSVRWRRGAWHCAFRDAKGVKRLILVRPEGDRPVTSARAKQVCAQYLEQVAASTFEAPSEQRGFSDAVDAWRRCLEVRSPTRAEYGTIVDRHILPVFGQMRLRDISVQTVKEFRAHLRSAGTSAGRALAVATANKVLTLLSMILGHAEECRWIRTNPSRSVKQLKRPLAEQHLAMVGAVLTPDECRRLIQAAGNWRAEAQRDKALIWLALETAAREGELLGLEWSNVDLSAGRIRIVRSIRKGKWSELKTASSRRGIGLTEGLAQQLRVWKMASPIPRGNEQWRDLVFLNTRGTGPMNPTNWLRRHWHPILRAAGLKRVRFHDLRHTSISLQLAAGIGPKQVQERAGHSSATMTMDRYGHCIPGAVDSSTELFAGMLASGTKAPVYGVNEDKARPKRAGEQTGET